MIIKKQKKQNKYYYLKSQNYFKLICSNDFFDTGNSAQTFVFQIWKTSSSDAFAVFEILAFLKEK